MYSDLEWSDSSMLLNWRRSTYSSSINGIVTSSFRKFVGGPCAKHEVSEHGRHQLVHQGRRTISMILPVLVSSSARLNTSLNHCVIGEKQPQVDMVVYEYDSIRIRQIRCNAMQRKSEGILRQCTRRRTMHRRVANKISKSKQRMQ